MKKTFFSLVFCFLLVFANIPAVSAISDEMETKIAFVNLFKSESAMIFTQDGTDVSSEIKKVLENNTVDENYNYIISNDLTAITLNENHDSDKRTRNTTGIATNGFTWATAYKGEPFSVSVGAEVTYNMRTYKYISRTKAHARISSGAGFTAGIEQANSSVKVNTKSTPNAVTYIPRVYIKKSGGYYYIPRKIRFIVRCKLGNQPAPSDAGKW